MWLICEIFSPQGFLRVLAYDCTNVFVIICVCLYAIMYVCLYLNFMFVCVFLCMCLFVRVFVCVAHQLESVLLSFLF